VRRRKRDARLAFDVGEGGPRERGEGECLCNLPEKEPTEKKLAIGKEERKGGGGKDNLSGVNCCVWSS